MQGDSSPTKYRKGEKSVLASSAAKSEADTVRSSCIFKTIGGVRDTAKELETSKERLRINAARNFIRENINTFVDLQSYRCFKDR